MQNSIYLTDTTTLTEENVTAYTCSGYDNGSEQNLRLYMFSDPKAPHLAYSVFIPILFLEGMFITTIT